MRRSIIPLLTLAVALAAADAGAVTLDPRGIGEALVYPYYTVNGGQNTLLTVNNASDVGKAAKVFVREGASGRRVLEFVIFLAPHDSWSGTLSGAGSAAEARIGTSDHSCVSHWTSNPQPFSTANFSDDRWNTADRTREGMIEIINGGDIVPGSPLDAATRPVQNGTAEAGAPTCAGIDGSLAFRQYLQAPTEGVAGSAAIVDVSQGTFYPYDAVALAGFSDTVLFDDEAAAWNGLERANSSDATHGVARATLLTGSGKPLTLDYARGIDAVSAVFMANRLYNDYLVNPDLGAATDWVVTFPTHEFYVDPQQMAGDTPAPFETVSEDDASPVSIQFHSYDREALTSTARCPPGFPICFTNLAYQVNVVPVTDTLPAPPPSILFSGLTRQQPLLPMSLSGRIDIQLDPADTHILAGGTTEAGDAIDLHGLPVTGFMVYNVINANAQPGRLANYSGLFRHVGTLRCTDAKHGTTNVCP